MPLSLVYKLEKDIVDGSSDKGAEVEEFAIDAVQRRLEEVALARVFAVE